METEKAPTYQNSLHGRYITLTQIQPLLATLGSEFTRETLGYSVMNQPIEVWRIGQGQLKVVAWSQMHGNETTTTKALIDFLFFLQSKNAMAQHFLRDFSFVFVPLLNPDGAQLYTRQNANGVDLNRDAVELSQPESRVLRQLITKEQPDFAFNLHDQRTIFGTTAGAYPATLSFLAPAFNEARDLNEVRAQVMQVTVDIFNVLADQLPHQIGRFDDQFNVNCIGDYLTTQGIPTLLFEAGHNADDYEREQTRGYVFQAFIAALQSLSSGSWKMRKTSAYFEIAENIKTFCDLLVKTKSNTYAFQYNEQLRGGKIYFELEPCSESLTSAEYGHLTFHAEEQQNSEFFKDSLFYKDYDCEISENGRIVVNNSLKNLKS